MSADPASRTSTTTSQSQEKGADNYLGGMGSLFQSDTNQDYQWNGYAKELPELQGNTSEPQVAIIPPTNNGLTGQMTDWYQSRDDEAAYRRSYGSGRRTDEK